MMTGALQSTAGGSNPLLSEKDIDEARKSITRALFAQEYECEWTTTESQIYEAYRRSKTY